MEAKLADTQVYRSARLRRHSFLLLLLSFVLTGGHPAKAQARCGAGVDLVVQALERMQANASNDQLEDANQLLKRATELCGELGEGWYYRSLVERKLGHAQLADFALRQSQRFPSDASTEQLNPFVLASPLVNASARGVTGSGPGPATTAPTPSGHSQRWALIIGIGNFTDKNIEPL